MSTVASSPSEVVRAYLGSFDRRRPEDIAAHVAEDFENVGAGALGTTCRGREAYLERLPDFLDSIAELHYEIEALVVDGPEVAAFYTLSGRWFGDRPFSVRGVQRLRVVDGEITHRTDYWDSATFLRQVDDDAAEVLRTIGLA